MIERIKEFSSLSAGINSRKIRIIMKLSAITSIDGVDPRNKAVKMIENSTIYNMANEAIITT